MSGITLSKKLFLLFFGHRIIHHLSIYLFFFFNIIFYYIIDTINVSIVFIFPFFRYLHFSSVDICVYIYFFFLLIFYNAKSRLKFVRSRLRSRTRVRSAVTLMTCLVIRNTLLHVHVY